jgi:hypothetical protein
MKNKKALIIFLLILSIQLVSIYPLYAYREFVGTNVNNFSNEKEELVFFIDNFEKVFLDYCDILRENGINVNYPKIQHQFGNFKDILQTSEPGDNIFNYIVNTLSSVISNPLTGAVAGAISGPVLGVIFGSGIVLAFDGGLSFIEIIALTFAGALITGILGAGIGGLLGIGIGAIFMLGGALSFGIIGALVGIIAGLLFGIILLPLLPIIIIISLIIFGILGLLIGATSIGLLSLTLLLPTGAFIGGIVGGAAGAAVGVIGGLGITLIEQLLFIPILLLLAAIGAVIGFFIGPPIGALLGFILPNRQSTSGTNLSAQRSSNQPVSSGLGIPPNIDNLTPTTPVLPSLNYSPFTTQAKLLTFLKYTEKTFYSNDRKIFTDLKGTLKPILENYNKVFGKNITKNITDKISNILNNADLTTPDGINEATAKILHLIPDTQNNY